MKIAFIINCHANAEQVFRLYKAIQHPDCYYLFHISTTSVNGFEKTLKEKLKGYQNVFFPKQEDGTHCEFGIVQATLNALSFLKKNKIPYDYASLISGQDYPLKPIEEIIEFYKQNNGKQFLVSFPILPKVDSEEYLNKVWFPTWSNQQQYRFDKYWTKTKFGRKAYPLNWINNKNSYHILKIACYELYSSLKKRNTLELVTDYYYTWKYRKQRSLPKSFTLHGGLTWWNITNDFAEYVLKEIKTNPEYISFFKTTLIPDEMFMQTILANSPYKNRLVNDDKRYIVWNWEINGTHPLTIEEKDFQTLISGEDHFARKFDIVNHPEIFNLIDKIILTKD